MASPNISFDVIPASRRTPGKYFEFNTKLAKRSLPTNLQKVLLVGQRLSSGTVAALTPVEVFSDEQAAQYFGRGSIAHRMAASAIEANRYAQVTVIAVDDSGAGVKAAANVVISGTAHALDALTFDVGQDRVQVAIAKGMQAETVAQALAQAINDASGLPVTAQADVQDDGMGVTVQVIVQARHAGECGNAIRLRASFAQGSSGGVSVAAPLALSGGANDPDLTPAFTAVFAEGYQLIAVPFATQAALAALRKHVEALGHPFEQRDVIGVYGFNGTLAAATTLAGTVNSGLVTGAWHNQSSCLPYEIAAAYAAVIASEEDPARPLNTLEVRGLDVIAVAARASGTEKEVALHNGVAPLEIGPGNRVQIVRAVTTYRVDAQGVADDALLDVTTMRTLHYFRRACRERIALRFPREKLSARTPPKVRSELLDVMHKCEELDILHRIAEFKDSLMVEVDGQAVGQLNAAIPAPVVPGLHVFAGRIDLYL